MLIEKNVYKIRLAKKLLSYEMAQIFVNKAIHIKITVSVTAILESVTNPGSTPMSLTNDQRRG